MRIVSENSAEEIARRRAIEGLGDRLRALTANLLRVTRGAGSAHDIVHQLQDLLTKFAEYQQACTYLPSSFELSDELHTVAFPRHLDGLPAEAVDQHYAQDMVIRGALQTVASRLVGQRTQETAGETELYAGVRELNEVREAERRKLAIQMALAKRRSPKRRQKKPGSKKRAPKKAEQE